MRSMTRTGVIKTPAKLEVEAETMAPGTFPLAMEVNATEDCTVDGTSVRNRIPMYISSVMNSVRGRRARPMRG